MRFARLALLLLSAAPLQAQTPDTTNGWNTPRALRLVERARARREQPRGDTALRSYSAKATGHVYFYLDRQDSDEQTLVKVDQVALELFWAAPNLTKQRIVGLRDVDRLPNKMYYHLDHLTVVQNGFGDRIRIGDGDEVRDVPHPAAPGSDSIYDFRLADSLTLTFPPQPPIKVYNVQVRPRRQDRPGYLGSIYVDDASADIVRLTFTFTPASYVDRRLDYINISLDNGLWNGSYWLPNEQYVEIRRQIPELDFAAGAIIKGRLRVYGYDFNQPFPRDFFFGRAVEAVPETERKAFRFDEDIYAGLEREELERPAQVDELRTQAAKLIGKRKLSGLPKHRLHVPNASSVLRYNETEGTYLGAGITYRPDDATRINLLGGFAFGPDMPEAMIELIRRDSARAYHVSARYREPRDAMWRPALPGALNTVSAALFDRDYSRLYFVNGVEAGVQGPIDRSTWTWTVAAEQHRVDTSLLVKDTANGRVYVNDRADDRDFFLTRLHADWTLFDRKGFSASLAPSAELGRAQAPPPSDFVPANLPPGTIWLGNDTRVSPEHYLRLSLSAALNYTSADQAGFGYLRVSGALIGGSDHPPRQKLLRLGGVGTIPGHAFAGMFGRAFSLVELEANRKLWSPWITARVLGAAAWVDAHEMSFPAPTYTQAVSAGAGVGLFWDMLRFDFIKGAGKPRLFFSVKPDFWDLL